MEKHPLTKLILNQCGSVDLKVLKGKKFNIGEDTSKFKVPGFYFLVDNSTNLVLSRYFIGNQRTNNGFVEKMGRFKAPRSYVDAKIGRLIELFGCTVVYMDYKSVNQLLKYNDKSILSWLTPNHTSKEQNYSEINRIINDKYTFVLQNY